MSEQKLENNPPASSTGTTDAGTEQRAANPEHGGDPIEKVEDSATQVSDLSTRKTAGLSTGENVEQNAESQHKNPALPAGDAGLVSALDKDGETPSEPRSRRNSEGTETDVESDTTPGAAAPPSKRIRRKSRG